MEIKLEGTAPSPAEKYKILLKAEGSLTSPMPSGSTDEGYVLSIKGSGTEKLPVLSFESPGVHTYTISQIKGSNSQCSYDETVYTMKVYVTNNENGPGLVSEIVLTVPGMDGKPEHIIFVNKYPTVPDRLTIRKRQHRRPIRIIPTIRTDRRLVTVPIYGCISAWAPSA